MEKEYFLKRLAQTRPTAFESYNYDLLPHTFLATDKIPIECLQHGPFYQKVSAHLFGAGCIDCGRLKTVGAGTLSTEDFVFKSKSKYGRKFGYARTHYVGKTVKLIVTCARHGDVEITPAVHYHSKHGCPQCNVELPVELKIRALLKKAEAAHDGKYDYSRSIPHRTTDKMEIVCPHHGSFWKTLYDHAVKKLGCTMCSKEADRLTLDEFISKAKTVHGDRYDYSRVIYDTSASMVIIACAKHGDFIQRAGSHLAGCKCKKCHEDENLLSTEEFIRNAKAVHGNSYDYSKVNYHGSKRPVEIICAVHGSFWQKPNTHVSSRNGCRWCTESKGERAIEVALKKYGIDHIREYRIVPYLYRYDFYLPLHDVYIEFHGHQHFRPVAIFGGEEALRKTKERDAMKRTIVKECGGRLITLTHLDLSNDSVEKVLIRKLQRYLNPFTVPVPL